MRFDFKADTKKIDQIINNDTKRDMLIRATAQQAAGNMQMSMTNSPATGKTYRRGSKTHIASSPGNPPRVDMGTLRASILPVKIASKKHAIRTSVLHGFETEFGVGMAPRPWMRPEIVRVPSYIVEIAKGMKLI